MSVFPTEGPKSRRGLWLIVTIVCIALLASGLTAVAVARPDNKGDATKVPALAAEPFVVTLSAALKASATLVGQAVVLGSQASGLTREVVALELWDGGRIVERTPVADHAGVSFTWTPLTTGAHLLHARGISRDGKTARSAPVAIDVLALRIKIPPVSVPTMAGETGSGLAARLGVAPSRITLRTRDGRTVKVGATVPAGATAQVEVTKSAQPPIAEAAVVPDTTPAGSGTPLGMAEVPAPFLQGSPGLVVQQPIELPKVEGPTASLEVTGCDVKVKVVDTDGRKATLEKATSGHPGFLSGDIRNGDGSFIVKNLVPGVQVWDVRTAEGVSSPVSATIPDACAKTGWQGNASLINGILTVPKTAEKLYVYLGVDDKPFVRIPAAQNEFLSAPSQRLDVSSLLPALDGKRLVLEVWHQPNDYTSTQLGTGTLEATDAESLQDVIGEPTAIDLAILTDNGEQRSLALEKDGPVFFNWKAASSRVTGVMWQVLAAPLTPANTDVSPYGLVAAGFNLSKGAGQFKVDTTNLPRPEAKKPALLLVPPDFTGMKPTLAKPAPSGAKIVDDLDKLAPPVVGRFWVRVLPLVHIDGQLFEGPMGIASSTVVVDLPVPVKPPITFAVASVTLTPGAIANPALRSCIRVTTPWTGPLPPTYPDGTFVETTAERTARHAKEDKARNEFGLNSAVARAFYPSSGTYCDGDFKHGEPCDDVFCYLEEAVGPFVEFVGDAWDYVAAAYNGIINLAVTLYAKYNPICAALTISKSKTASTCEQIAAIVTRAAISAVLAAYGLPPSLPTSSELVAIAQGDLAVLAVELLKEFGVPCDSLKLDETESAVLVEGGKKAGVDIPNAGGKVDACLIAANYVINKVKEQVIAQTQKAVAGNAGLPYFEVAGLTLIPEPKGHLQPTVMTVVAVPSEPIGGIQALFLPPCELATNITTKSGNVAPFKNVRGKLHRLPTSAPSDPLAGLFEQVNSGVAAITGIPAGAWAENLVMATPSMPNLDVDSVYEGLTLKGTVSGSCLTGNQTPVQASYGPPLNR